MMITAGFISSFSSTFHCEILMQLFADFLSFHFRLFSDWWGEYAVMMWGRLPYWWFDFDFSADWFSFPHWCDISSFSLLDVYFFRLSFFSLDFFDWLPCSLHVASISFFHFSGFRAFSLMIFIFAFAVAFFPSRGRRLIADAAGFFIIISSFSITSSMWASISSSSDDATFHFRWCVSRHWCRDVHYWFSMQPFQAETTFHYFIISMPFSMRDVPPFRHFDALCSRRLPIIDVGFFRFLIIFSLRWPTQSIFMLYLPIDDAAGASIKYFSFSMPYFSRLISIFIFISADADFLDDFRFRWAVSQLSSMLLLSDDFHYLLPLHWWLFDIISLLWKTWPLFRRRTFSCFHYAGQHFFLIWYRPFITPFSFRRCWLRRCFLHYADGFVWDASLPSWWRYFHYYYFRRSFRCDRCRGVDISM